MNRSSLTQVKRRADYALAAAQVRTSAKTHDGNGIPRPAISRTWPAEPPSGISELGRELVGLARDAVDFAEQRAVIDAEHSVAVGDLEQVARLACAVGCER